MRDLGERKNRFRERAGNFSRRCASHLPELEERYGRSFTRARAIVYLQIPPRAVRPAGGRITGGVVGVGGEDEGGRGGGSRSMNEAECVLAIARPMSAFRDLATAVLNSAYVHVCMPFSRYLFALPCVEALYANFARREPALMACNATCEKYRNTQQLRRAICSQIVVPVSG